MVDVVKVSVPDRDLRRLPKHIVRNLNAWINSVETVGLAETRKIPGYHDEPLKGDRKGQRSVRLNQAYRAFYKLEKGVLEVEVVEYVDVIEVNKHRY